MVVIITGASDGIDARRSHDGHELADDHEAPSDHGDVDGRDGSRRDARRRATDFAPERVLPEWLRLFAELSARSETVGSS